MSDGANREDREARLHRSRELLRAIATAQADHERRQRERSERENTPTPSPDERAAKKPAGGR
jgi:hypothetical protein